MFRRLSHLLLPLVAVATVLAQPQSQLPARKPSALAEQLRTPQPNVPAGKVESLTIADPYYKKTRKLWVYTPSGYSKTAAVGYDLLLCFDGESYIGSDGMALPTVLNNLTAQKKVRPMVAVMLDNGMRGERLNDLANRADFTKFVGEILVPWVRKNYNVTTDPAHSVITGYSAGGLAAANIAFFYPNEFGNVLAQSPALWRGREASNDAPYEWLLGQVKSSAKKPVKFYIEMGALETMHTMGGQGPVPLEAARRFRDALLGKGYTVQYKEVENAAHEVGHWRDELPEGILYLLGTPTHP